MAAENRLGILRAEYVTVYKALVAERQMREHVFRHDAARRRAKVQEIDRALVALERIKDMAKALLEADGAREPEHPRLIGGGE